MRASRLDDAVVLCHEAAEGCGEEVDCGEQSVLDGDDGGDVHGGREGVVRALRHVRMVVRMENFLPCDLVAAVRDDLVDVHIGLRAAARLPYSEREVGGELAVEDFITCLADGGEPLLVQFAERVVGDGGGLFQDAECVDDLGGHLLNADGEVLEAALRLRRPVLVCGDFDLAEGIMLNAILHGYEPPVTRKDRYCGAPSAYATQTPRYASGRALASLAYCRDSLEPQYSDRNSIAQNIVIENIYLVFIFFTMDCARMPMPVPVRMPTTPRSGA